MNTNHYTDLDRCKKLNQLGFPDTELGFFPDIQNGASQIWNYRHNSRVEQYVCPSVMELLDELPYQIDTEDGLCFLSISKDWKWEDRKQTDDYDVDYQQFHTTHGTLPNALADMWIWCVENGFVRSEAFTPPKK